MYKIQEFSNETGVSKRMLRYLEEQGLLIPKRMDNDYRIYQAHHLEEIRWIQFWQRLGFSLLQIKTLKNLHPSKFEEYLENVLIKKKNDLANHSTQVLIIRDIIKKIRKIDQTKGPVDIKKEFNCIESWTTSTCEDFLTQLDNYDRVVYGKFPEIDVVTKTITSQMMTIGFEVNTESCDLIKVGEALPQLPSTEVAIWERKSDYSYFFLAISENILTKEFADKFEDCLFSVFGEAIDNAFYPGKINQAGRLFNANDILQIYGGHEIIFRNSMTLKWNHKQYDFYIFIPFQFVHASRQGRSHESTTLGRSLQKSVIELTHEQILNKTKHIPNQKYLLTALLADAETRSKMFAVLSSQAKELVMKDISEMVAEIQQAWSD